MFMSRIKCMGFLQVLVVFLGVGVAVSSTSILAAPAAKVKATAKKSAKPSSPPKAITPATPEVTQSEPIYAMVNNKPITVREYRGLMAEIMRGRYYHGKIPEGKAEALYKEVADMLVDRELLFAEAEKRGIRPDPAKFEKTLADMETRFAAEPAWKENREQWLPQIKANMDRQSMVEQLEKAVRNVPQPSPAEVRAYYAKRPDLFTEPERLRMSIILLKVDPGGAKEEWDLARDEAQKIVDRIKGGADFAEQARLHSQHASAANGGDMGYLHGGMLPGGMEDKLENLQVGVVNEPITTLEGIVVPRVEDRIPPKLHDFPEVEARAQDLLVRELADEAWQKTISLLRAGAKIKIVTPQVASGK